MLQIVPRHEHTTCTAQVRAREPAVPTKIARHPHSPFLKPHLCCSLTLHRLKQQPPLAASIVVGPELARDAAVEAHITRSMLLIQEQEDEEAITRSLASAADEAAARKTTPKRRKHTKFEGAPNSAGLPSAGGSGSKPSHAMCLK